MSISQALERARTYEAEAEHKVCESERPAFHFSPRIGWLNDPNGFSYYDGQYHLFYQYHPYDSVWGPMHWGHAVSDDMIRWTYLPAAMAPDEPYDKDGCFSGTAITLPDGKQMLMYTGVVHDKSKEGFKLEQCQCLAFGDGENYEKYDANPVLTAADLPEGGSLYDFRDPKVWQLPDGSYRMIAVCRNENGYTQVPMYRSSDALQWEFDHVLAENHDCLGRMWECPDYFRLDGREVLMVSAMDMLPEGLEYTSGNNSIYLVGACDPSTGAFIPASDHVTDYGIDFYAPQTAETPDGRRVMIGWMQNPDTTGQRTVQMPIFGQMSVPRELKVRDGILYQRPIRELEAYRSDEVIHRDVLVADGGLTLEGIRGRQIDMEVEIEALDSAPMYREFRCRFAANDRDYTEIRFDPASSVVTMDRRFSGQRRAMIGTSDAEVAHCAGKLRFRLIMDRYSAEVFINDGEKVMTMTLFTDLDAQGIRFEADGRVKLNVCKYDLNI